MGRHRLISAAILPLTLIFVACSSSGGATPSPSAAASTTPSTAPSAAASPSAEASPTSSATAAEDSPLKASADGKYLTGEDGMTLYIFQKDTQDSGKSVCNGDCATNWPPYAVDATDAVEAEGASGTLSIVTRDDGSKQLAYNGWPLYYFAGDKAAGDTNGATIPNWALAKP